MRQPETEEIVFRLPLGNGGNGGERLGYTGCRGLLLLVVSGETRALAKLNKWMGKQKTLADNQRFFVNINCATLGSLKRLLERGDNGVLLVFA